MMVVIVVPGCMETRGVVATYRRTAREYARYVGTSTGLFLLCALIGVGLYVGGVDLFALLGQNLSDILPDIEHLSKAEIFATILLNNSRAFLVFVIGAVTLGVLTAFALASNGVLIGYVMAQAAASRGILFVVVGIGPHGIFELPALFVAAAIGFRLVERSVRRLFGRRDSVMTHGEWKRTALLGATAMGVLAFAAFVEAFVTSTLLEILFAG